jgi:hypothetical protein
MHPYLDHQKWDTQAGQDVEEKQSGKFVTTRYLLVSSKKESMLAILTAPGTDPVAWRTLAEGGRNGVMEKWNNLDRERDKRS